MKLRIKGDSLRLRVSPSEVVQLLETGRIEEIVHFGLGDETQLTYAFELSDLATAMTARYQAHEITVLVSGQDARRWADGSEVGIYGEVGVGRARLEIVVEKDFACLDKSEVDNRDTFPNPKHGAAC